MSKCEKKHIKMIVDEILHDEEWVGEDEFREYFGIVPTQKSVDGGCHAYGCATYLVECKGGKIREAFQQFRSVIEHIELRGHLNEKFEKYQVVECIISCEAIRDVRKLYEVKGDGYLYFKHDRRTRVRIHMAEVSVRYRG